VKVQVLTDIDSISSTDWQRLAGDDSPFLSQAYLHGLESSGCVGGDSGWHAYHLQFDDDVGVQGIIPAYVKTHSWGEFVFDWGWAEAYEQHGLEYYPKLVCTTPFTPVSGNKVHSHAFTHGEVLGTLSHLCEAQSLNSWHMLFCPKIEQLPPDVFERHTVQFHWFNRDYVNFDDFLSRFTARKRKNTRKERQSIVDQGLAVVQLRGADIGDKELEFFFECYQQPYLKRGHTPHLNKAFFEHLFTQMPDNVLLVLASHQQRYVASALFMFDCTTLYGRYWGCVEEFNNLHFELCYYQGIEFCIANDIASFNPGAQGEHKIKRGFEPVITYSYHWVKEPGFRGAIKDFCRQECDDLQQYFTSCQQALPFNTNAN